MKKGMTSMFGIAVLSLSLVSVAVPMFAFTSQQGISGGWSESLGYYINGSDGFVSDSSAGRFKRATSSSKPDKHEGQRLTQYIGSKSSPVVEYAAYGRTVWKDMYHYTTARMENYSGKELTTSGRRWGTGVTTAQSPWYQPWPFENTEARTYWGNEE